MTRASVAELHGLDPFAGGSITRPEVIWCEPTDSALVLGPRQSPDLVDIGRCRQLGLSIVRRRSGGGAVLIVPDTMLWIDLIVPHGVAPDDVRDSMRWAGERWREALRPFAPTTGMLDVHGASMVVSAWSDLVCFAGVGPGEVLLDGVKLVGLSQRRTRAGVRIQGAMHLASPAIDIASLFVGPTPAAVMPVPAALAIDRPEELVARLAHGLGINGEDWLT